MDMDKLKPMDSVGVECNELKKQYEDCFNVWYTDKFLKGKTQDTPCSPLFAVYKECLKNTLTKQKMGVDLEEIEKDVLGTDQEQTQPK